MAYLRYCSNLFLCDSAHLHTYHLKILILLGGLDAERMNELQKVLNYINSMSDSDEYSWADLLSLIVNEVHAPITSPNEMVEEFIINNWRDNF